MSHPTASAISSCVYHGEGDAITSFVVSLNLKRRHLNESQRGMVGARIANLGKGGDRRSEDFKGSNDLFNSQSDAAEMMNVSVPAVKRAAAVQRTGAPELVAAVEYARQIGRAQNTVSEWISAAKVAKNISDIRYLFDKVNHLSAIHSAPEPLWPAFVNTPPNTPRHYYM